MILSLISNTLKSLAGYLELKKISFYYDIHEKSNKKQQQLIDEIEKLRKSPSSVDQSRADLLRAMLQTERDYINDLSTYYSITREK